MRRLALLGAFLAPVSCELSSAYLYDYAFHKSTQEALDYNLNVLWKMGEVMATGMATDLVYNASGPGDLHGRLRSGDGTLSLLVYSLLIGESLATWPSISSPSTSARRCRCSAWISSAAARRFTAPCSR